MAALYLKYRPSNFDEVIGQQHITDILKAELLSGKIAHAYLFVGPRGTGKTSTARILAKAINCLHLDKTGNPCNKCNICTLANSGRLLDIIEIDAASNRRIDEIRALKEKIEYRPSLAKYKVYIIDEVHMLTKEAFNALLKTLEEPPEHVVFILATTEPHKVPITIASRCERFEFRLGTADELSKVALQVAKQERVTVDAEALRVIVEHAAGSYRDLLSLLDSLISKLKEGEILTYELVKQALGLPDETMVYYFISSVFAKEESKTFDMLDEIFQRGINLDQFLKGVIVKLRDLAIAYKTQQELEKDGYGFLREFTVSDILHFISLLLKAQTQLKNTFDVKLPIQLAVLEMVNYLQFSNKTFQAALQTLESVKHVPQGQVHTSKSTQKMEVLEPDEKSLQLRNVQRASKTVRVATKNKPKKESKNKAIEAKKAASNQSSNNNLTLARLQEKWHEFIEQLKPYNGHLYAFLLRAKPVELTFDSEFNAYTLQVDVKYKFHKERIELAVSQQAIRELGSKIFGTNIKIVANVNSDLINESISSKKVENGSNVVNHKTSSQKGHVSKIREKSTKKKTVGVSAKAEVINKTKGQTKADSFKPVEEEFGDIFADAVEL